MYLRVSITDRCNLRCTYCLPERARFAPAGTTVEELRILMALVARTVPLHKLRLTGGEPTLEPSLVDFVRDAAAIVPTVGLTTNGVHLEPLLPALREAGLTRLNVSLDAAEPRGFRLMSRRDGFEAVLSSLRAARREGFSPLKVNCVATQGTDAPALVDLALREGFHLRFIELMSIGEARPTWAEAFISSEQLRERIVAAGHDLRARIDLDEPTSRVWSVVGAPAGEVSLGFITTVTQPFCDSCDRLRLTRAGRLHYCLFDATGADLIGPLRRDGEAAVERVIRQVVARKQPPPHFQREQTMAAIGG